MLVVSDDSPRIPTQDRDRVFDRFVRIDEARTPNAGGAGLGLAITRAVVERNEGTIVVEDSSSGGAAFRVTLPRTAAG